MSSPRTAARCPPAPVEPSHAVLVEACISVLAACERFVRSLDAADYTAESRILPGGTIGRHVRHLLDHFRAPLEAAGVGVADYDARRRDVPMERHAPEALAQIGAVRAMLERADPGAMNAPLRVRMMLDSAGARAELLSTLGRELAFAMHHAVHHQAMLGAMARERGVPVEPGFGMAPSTVHHERDRCSECARSP